MNNKYREYFNIDDEYFPQINDYSIAAAGPDFWLRTYPHQTFINLLYYMERVLARQEKRSIWIEGAYGTGKSQCAYALKKILDVSEEEVKAYWDRYVPLRKKPDLLNKLLGHKEKGIVTAHRYASGSINSPRDLFFAIQESIKNSLLEKGLYTGENTLKESVIAWIEKPANKKYFNDLLQSPEWSALFPQSSADEVLNALRKGGEIKTLMDNIFQLSDKEGIVALTIDADMLIKWLSDVIDINSIKIVLIWDEFSDYFKNNRDRLSEFQKIVELVNLKPFFFIVVTHESGQLFTVADDTWTKVRDRFIPVNIALPDNIAFDLIGHAFNVKPAAKDKWSILADDLNSRVNASRNVVMNAAKITNRQVMKDIMPLHPVAALLLKNIASAFKSNQRSMFDFIKSSDIEGEKAFQWFIENKGPMDNHPLLTVDMLWDFFYEKGKDNLTSDIRLILDTFPLHQNLREDEKSVLKAILLLQAMDQRLSGAIDLFKATDQNLGYVFEGISSGLDVSCKNIAKQLVKKGILVTNPIGDGKHVYSAAVLAGDQSKIDRFKKDIRQNSTTSKLVAEGDLCTVLSLPPALRLRFENEPGTGKITTVTVSDFTRTINILQDKPMGWNFYLVIAFAKDEEEMISFRKTIKNAVKDKKYENILFIDTLSTPLGLEAFEQYVDHSAMAMYHSGSNNAAARESSDKAKRILDMEWKNRIYNGQFIIYSYTNQEGEKLGNGQGVASVLQTTVMSRFPDTFDFTRGISENQLKLTSAKASAKCGIIQNTSGVVVGLEKHIFATVWNVDKYWKMPGMANLSISKIKLKIENIIESFFSSDGQISIGTIYDFLEKEFGFAPCNLSAFITGFLLKEYSKEPYRYSDSSGGHEPMTQDKLSEMIGNYIGRTPKPTYIVKMTVEEMAFYELTEKAWEITPNSCASVGQAAAAVSAKMRNFGLPVWCLDEVDECGVYDIVQKYIELIKVEGSDAHKKAVEIGKIAIVKERLSVYMHNLLTIENCQKGMNEFLKTFEGGKILELAKDIGAEESVLSDIRSLFTVKYSSLWDKNTGKDEIRKLLIEYGFVRESNSLLNVLNKTRDGALTTWREKLRFINISYEAMQAKYPSIDKVLRVLLKIYQQEDILPDHLKTFIDGIKSNRGQIQFLIDNEMQLFKEIYAPYLEGLNDNDIGEVKSKLPNGMFALQDTACNEKVKVTTEGFRQNQLKTKMFNLWRDKTNTKNPREWSSLYRTPILCCVPESNFSNAKKAFDVLNRSWATDREIKDTIIYLNSTQIFEDLLSKEKRDEAFIKGLIGKLKVLLRDLDAVRNKLERLAVDTYEWYGNPDVKNKIYQLAEAEYNAGGSDKALSKIDNMDDAKLKQYLKRLVKDNITVGIEIITDGGE